MEALATLRGYEVLPRNHYATVMNHLANVGPLSVAVAAGDWSYYRDGVFDGCSYDSNIEINHGMYVIQSSSGRTICYNSNMRECTWHAKRKETKVLS